MVRIKASLELNNEKNPIKILEIETAIADRIIRYSKKKFISGND